MIDQDMDSSAAEPLDWLDWMARPVDIEHTAAAIIAISRREWLSQGHASPSPDETVVDRTRLQHSLFILALDAKRSCS